MTATVSPERRKDRRVDESFAISVSEQGPSFQAETRNISLSGVYCTLDRFIAPMTKLQLEYEIPDGKKRTSIRCTGVVVRAEPIIQDAQHARYNVAIFFSDMEERDRNLLARFVNGHLTARH